MAKKKFNLFKIIGLLSPEILFFCTQLFLVISCYLVFVRKSEDWIATTILVSSTLTFMNFTILFRSMRPFQFKKHFFKSIPPSNWTLVPVPAFFFFYFIAGSFILPLVILTKTSYAAAQFMIISGTAPAIIFLIGTIIGRKGEGLSRPLFKKIRVWHGASVLYIIIGTLTIFIADWNPLLQHYNASLKVVRQYNSTDVSLNDICRADIGVYPASMKKAKCRIRLFCNGKRLFGNLGQGIIDCKTTVTGENINIYGGDDVTSDGDPALRINTHRKRLTFSRRYPLPGGVEFEASITSLKKLTIPVFKTEKKQF